jgi:beta-lactamase regulating signal transducer with metallopeptidase domain
MEQMMHMATLVSAAAASSLLGAVWQGAVLVACVALGLKLLPKLSAAARSGLWLAVLGVVVLLPFVGLLRGGASLAGSPQALHVDVRWSLLVAGVWIAWSLVRAVQLIRSAVYLQRIWRRATPVAVVAGTQIRESGPFGTLRAGSGAPAVVTVCASADVDRPSVVGFFSPRILIPPTLLERLPQAELQQVVLHEMEHLRRRDDWTNLLQKLSLVLFPLNPALVWIERQLCLERELACDDHVLQATGARKAYATCLANLAEHSLLRRGAMLALGAWEKRSELAQRVHRILRRPEERMSPWQMRVAMAMLTIGVAGGSVALARSPELVSFAPVMTDSFVAGTYVPNAGHGAPEVMGGSMVLTKAIVPEHQTPAERHKPRLHKKSAPVVNAVAANDEAVQAREFRAVVERQRAMSQAAMEQAAWMVMTEWHEEQERAVPVRLEVIRPAFVAVPVGNGWLVVQI